MILHACRNGYIFQLFSFNMLHTINDTVQDTHQLPTTLRSAMCMANLWFG